MHFCTLQRLNSSNSSELVETDSRILQTPSAVLLLPPQSGERPICFFLNRSALSELVEGNQAGGGRGQQGSPWQPGQPGQQGSPLSESSTHLPTSTVTHLERIGNTWWCFISILILFDLHIFNPIVNVIFILSVVFTIIVSWAKMNLPNSQKKWCYFRSNNLGPLCI